MKIAALCAIVVLSLPSTAHAAKVYGVAVAGTTQSLVTWDSAAPGVILSTVAITGMPAGETIRGMDSSPDPFFGTSRLFAIGAGSGQFANVYRLDQLSGMAVKLPPSGAPPADAIGENYGVTSFGSATLRSVAESGLRSGHSTTFNSGDNGTMIYAPGDINAGATPHLVHLFNFYAVDTALDILTSFPNSGNPTPVTTIGSLGANFDDAGAIDALTENHIDTIYAALLPAGQTQSSFYTLNQQTGATTLIGAIGNGVLITAMSVEPPLPVPEPSTALLRALGLVACVRLRGVRSTARPPLDYFLEAKS